MDTDRKEGYMVKYYFKSTEDPELRVIVEASPEGVEAHMASLQELAEAGLLETGAIDRLSSDQPT